MHMWERERERGEKKTARYVVVKDPERQSIIFPIWHVRSKPIFHYTRRASLECRTYLIFKVKTKDEKKRKRLFSSEGGLTSGQLISRVKLEW